MSISILDRHFEGPFADSFSLKNLPGVYVILGNNGGDNWEVVDVGESDDVRWRVENHDRKKDWQRQELATLAVAALYTRDDRGELEREIRNFYAPLCGVM